MSAASRYPQVVAQLTALGAPFEVVETTIGGRPMRNWKHRERSMREEVANLALRGDLPCMVHGERNPTGTLLRNVFRVTGAVPFQTEELG